MPEQLDACILCGAPALKRDRFAESMLNLSAEHGVAQCAQCGFRFLNPRPTADDYRQLYEGNTGPLVSSYSPIADFYNETDQIRLPEYRRKLHMLKQLGAGPRLLEIGSCTGVFLNEARQAGFDVEGIEPSNQSRRRAQEQFGLELHGGNIEDVDLPTGHYDVVFSSHVFEHLADPRAVAERVVAWLKPGGLHMIEVPNQFDYVGARIKRLGIYPLRPYERSFRSVHHTVFFSRRTLRLLAELTGCHLIHVRSVYHQRPNMRRGPGYLLRRAAFALTGGGPFIESLARKPPAASAASA